MYYTDLMQGFDKKIEVNKELLAQLDETLSNIDNALDGFTNTMNAVHRRLTEAQVQKKTMPGVPQAQGLYLSEEDFKKRIEQLLEGSLEGLGDTISRKILDKLKDLKGSVGVDREAKIRELKQSADLDVVDLSSLFQEKIESNIDDIGVQEQQTKGIDKSLEKLRQIKENKNKADAPIKKKE